MMNSLKFCGDEFPSWACGPNSVCNENGTSCGECSSEYVHDFTMSLYENCAVPEQGLRAMYWLLGISSIWAGSWAMLEIPHARSQAKRLLQLGSTINVLVPFYLIAHSTQGRHEIAAGAVLFSICAVLGFGLLPILIYSLTKPMFSVQRKDPRRHKKQLFGGLGISFTCVAAINWALSSLFGNDAKSYQTIQIATAFVFALLSLVTGYATMKSADQLISTITLVQKRAPRTTAGNDPISAYVDRASSLRRFVIMFTGVQSFIAILTGIIPLVSGSLRYQWIFWGLLVCSLTIFTLGSTAYARNLNRYDTEELKNVRNMLANLKQGSSHEGSGSGRDRNNSAYSGSMLSSLDGSKHGGKLYRKEGSTTRFSYKPKPMGRQDELDIEDWSKDNAGSFSFKNPSPTAAMAPVDED